MHNTHKVTGVSYTHAIVTSHYGLGYHARYYSDIGYQGQQVLACTVAFQLWFKIGIIPTILVVFAVVFNVLVNFTKINQCT